MNTPNKEITFKEAESIYTKSLEVKNGECIKIKISAGAGGLPFIKQLQSFNSIWSNCQFFINQEIAECDLWVVYGNLEKEETTICPKGNTLFITNEPPSVKKYQGKFLNQFGTIITCHKDTKHPHTLLQQQALPWWVGHKVENTRETTSGYRKTYDELTSITSIEKTKVISLIASNKTFTRGHKKRYDFLKKIKDALGDAIDIFGVGFNQINDKWDAIAPYKYSIVLENSSYPDYWTEKLADTFLGQSYPIYYGCSNIYDYFPKSALSTIDISKPDEAIEKIKNIINSGKYEESVTEIANAKNAILNTYQLFPLLCEYANKNKSLEEKIVISLKPESKENLFQKIVRKISKHE